MKTIETKLFSYNELNPEAQEKVFQDWSESEQEYCLDTHIEEMKDSLEGLFECLGFRLVDWSFGAYCYDWKCKAGGIPYDLQGESGPRVLAYVQRRLVNAGYDRSKRFRDMTFPGHCHFTGVCYDEDLAECLWKELLDGETIEQAINSLGQKLSRMCESELEYLTSKECFLDMVDCSEEIYTEEGERF